jgi:hypothetical protein
MWAGQGIVGSSFITNVGLELCRSAECSVFHAPGNLAKMTTLLDLITVQST